MDCKRIREEIAVRGTGEQHVGHLAGCELCRAWLADWRLGVALQALPVPEPSAGFIDRALRAAHSPRVPHAPAAGIAAAAAVLLTVAVGWLATLTPAPRQEAPPQVRMVSVLIEARASRADALVTIELGEGLELEGFAEQRRIEWRTELLQGRNLLELPVRSRPGTDGDIRIALSYDGEQSTQLTIPVRAG